MDRSTPILIKILLWNKVPTNISLQKILISDNRNINLALVIWLKILLLKNKIKSEMKQTKNWTNHKYPQ